MLFISIYVICAKMHYMAAFACAGCEINRNAQQKIILGVF